MFFIPDATGPKNHSCQTDSHKKMDFTILSARINSILEYFTISKIELFYKGTILKLSFNRKNY